MSIFARGAVSWVFAFVLMTLAFASHPAQAASSIDVYDFPSTEVEDRYRALIQEFRCPKCLNTNIAGSDAPIAQDLRTTVYRLLVVEGFSDDEIRDYLHERYGDFVLYDPPLSYRTVWLWFAPGFFLLLGVFLLWRVRRSSSAAAPLADDERQRLAALSD
ncbi:unnamed protein product, partial [Laminaria digitata]